MADGRQAREKVLIEEVAAIFSQMTEEMKVPFEMMKEAKEKMTLAAQMEVQGKEIEAKGIKTKKAAFRMGIHPKDKASKCRQKLDKANQMILDGKTMQLQGIQKKLEAFGLIRTLKRMQMEILSVKQNEAKERLGIGEREQFMLDAMELHLELEVEKELYPELC